MASRKLRFAIFGNTYQPKKSESFQKLLACLMSRRAEVLIEREFYTFLTEGQQLPVEGVKVCEYRTIGIPCRCQSTGDRAYNQCTLRR